MANNDSQTQENKTRQEVGIAENHKSNRKYSWPLKTYRLFPTKFSHLLIFALPLFWLLFIYHHYLPRLNQVALKEISTELGALLIRSGFLDILLVIWVWLAAYLAGRQFVAWLGVNLEPGIERISISSAAGLASMSLSILLLASVKMLYRPVVWALLLLSLAVWWPRLRELAPKSWQRSPQGTNLFYSSSERLGYLFLVGYIVVVLGIILISALGPAIEFDDLAYHLPTAKAFVNAHGIKPIPDIPHTFLPRNIEMLYTLGMLVHNEVTAKLINYLLGILTMGASYALAVRFFRPSTGLLSSAVLASSPLFLWEMRTTQIDVGLALFLFLSLYATIIWFRNQDPAWFRLIICFLAFSLGIKYHALFALGSLCALLFLQWIIWLKDFRQATLGALKLFLLSILGLVPWGLINLIYTGDPLFPLLNRFIHTPYWNSDLTQFIWDQQRNSGISMTFANGLKLVTVFWQMVVDQTGTFHGNLGPFYLMLIPLVIFRRRIDIEIKLILAFSFFYSLMWLFTGQHARYCLPLLPGLAVAASYATTGWLNAWQDKGHRLFVWLAGTVLAFMAVLNLPLFEKYGANSRYGYGLIKTFPVRYLLGQESKDAYLARNLPGYRAMEFFNEIRGQKKLLFSWVESANLFYVDSEAAWLFSTIGPSLVKSEDPKEIHAILRENGITHMLVSQLVASQQKANLLTRPDGEFARQYLKKIYRKDATVLYAVEPLSQETVCYDFLGRIDEAIIKMPSEPPHKANSDYRMVLGILEDQRYVLVTFPPAEVKFNLTLCQQPVLKFAIGQWIPKCSGKGSFQVWVVPRNGKQDKVFDRELDAENKPQDVGWFEEQLDLNTYAGQQIELIFKTKHLGGGGCTWYTWADPVILSSAK